MSKFIIPDLDLDMSSDTREKILNTLQHIPASKITENSITPHNIGVYFSDIPQDRISGLASIDYKKAEEDYGFIKIDCLHNSIYDSFKTRQELFDILKKPIDWKLLYKQDIVEKLPQIGNYYTLINQLPKIDSIEKLAMMIALIRPSKKYLIDIVIKQGWDAIKDKIWIKEENSGYQYKKSHAIAFALSITVVMRSISI